MYGAIGMVHLPVAGIDPVDRILHVAGTGMMEFCCQLLLQLL
jgi:hypothetical protein